MKRKRHPPAVMTDDSGVDGALAAMNAEQLRDLVRDLLLELDDKAHGRVMDSLIDRAARGNTEWIPDGPTPGEVASIVSFVEAASRVGYADPSEVDDYLRQGTQAFLRKDYPAAAAIFRVLLPALADGEIYLGQDEMAEEVIGVDLAGCAAQQLVATYMTAEPEQRARAVRTTMDEVQELSYLSEPLREMERVAVEPLPRLKSFLPQWRALIEENAGARTDDWDSCQDSQLREVVLRMEGTEGLAALARSTRRAGHLRAWCRALVQAGDWEAALAAYAEAAQLVTDRAHSRAEFLDGAALAAQELDCGDLPKRLESAWQAAPHMLRLRRWLGSSKSKATLRKRATRALGLCPGSAARQRALIHLILGDPVSAAKLLEQAPGLGWSDKEHPGHMLFAHFPPRLGGTALCDRSSTTYLGPMDMDEFEGLGDGPAAPVLAAPEVDQILKLAGVSKPPDADKRSAMLSAMKKAAQKRLAGVTKHQRRRHYDHAAELVATCAASDLGSKTSRWVADLRKKYSRFSALQREFTRHIGPRVP